MSELTLLIVTQNRTVQLRRCLESVSAAIESAHTRSRVQVLVVDNGSADGTASTIASFESRISLRQISLPQLLPANPASALEGCLPAALEQVHTEYVWLLSEGDELLPEGLERLLALLASSPLDLLLLNQQWLGKSEALTPVRTTSPTVIYSQGEDLFRDCGIASLTAQPTGLCFRTKGFNLTVWKKLSPAADKFALPLTLLCSFQRRPAAFVDFAVTLHQEEELDSVPSATRESAVPCVAGLIQALQEVASQTGLSIHELTHFEETEITASQAPVVNSLTGWVLARMFITQLRYILRNGSRPLGPSDFDLIRRFFAEMRDQDCASVVRTVWQHFRADDATTEEKLTLLASHFDPLCGRDHIQFRLRTLSAHNFTTPCFLYSLGTPYKVSRGVAGDAHGAPQPAWNPEQTRLSILIPTYSRSRNLAQLLQNLRRLELDQVPGLEIFIADNRSEDRTPEVCRAAMRVMPNVRAQRFEEHKGSCEENVDRSVPFARGEYVWLMGDDDELVRPVAYLLLNVIWLGSETSYVFNNLRSHEREHSTNEPNRPIRQYFSNGAIGAVEPVVSKPLATLTKAYGCISAMAFISRYIFRRDALLPFGHYCEISPIYAHVFGFLESFSRQPTTLINYPLVFRAESNVGERLTQLGKALRRHFYFPWTNGLVRLATAAADRGVISENFLLQVRETNGPAIGFQLSLEMRLQFIRQCRLYLEGRDPAQIPALADVQELFDYLQRGTRRPSLIDSQIISEYRKLACLEESSRNGTRPMEEIDSDFAAVRENLATLTGMLLAPPAAPAPAPAPAPVVPAASIPTLKQKLLLRVESLLPSRFRRQWLRTQMARINRGRQLFPNVVRHPFQTARMFRQLAFRTAAHAFEGFKSYFRDLEREQRLAANPPAIPTGPGYIIVAPAFVANSAGIYCLYQLCDELNRRGFPAFVAGSSKTTSHLLAPLINWNQATALCREGYTAVYPETVEGNPLGAAAVARWVLNRPGLLGGHPVYADSEQVFYYSDSLLPYIKNRIAGKLYMPTIDEDIFYTDPEENSGRSLECFYIGKSQWKDGYIDRSRMFEITRETPKKRELGKLFRSSKVLYCFDNSTILAYEALMCGCPVVIIPDGTQTREDYRRLELGMDGIAWGIDELEQVRADVPKLQQRYAQVKHDYRRQLNDFITITQSRNSTAERSAA